jgi:hypothetical protein
VSRARRRRHTSSIAEWVLAAIGVALVLGLLVAQLVRP